jgi:hypothetical protein
MASSLAIDESEERELAIDAGPMRGILASLAIMLPIWLLAVIAVLVLF